MATLVPSVENAVCASPFCDVEFLPRTHNQKYHDPQCKRDVENISRRRLGTKDSALLDQEAEILRSSAVPGDIDVQAQLEYLRSLNRSLAKENAKLKVTKYELVHAVNEAVLANLQDLKLPKIAKPTLDRRRKTPETCIAHLSDWQIGKKTLTYNVEQCERNVNLYAEKQLRITDIQRADHPVQDLRVWLGGDMVEGEMIFPGQAHHLDKSLYYQVAVDGPRIIVNYLRRMLENFDNIHVTCVPGNHGAIGGRMRHETHPETNADRMLYSIVQQILADEPRITWNIVSGEHEGDFYGIDTIGEKNYLLMHGHEFRGSAGVPVASIDRKIKGWRMDAIPEHFDYVAMGHFHTPSRLTVNSVTVYINGTTETGNGYAREVLAAIGRPCQYLLFAHPEHGITAEYPVFLDHE